MLGPHFIRRFLPHRPPFLMVESVTSYRGGEAPSLTAERPIRPTEDVFAGSEPPLSWPSVYVLEGLGQCSSLLSVLTSCERRFHAMGFDADSFAEALANLDDTAGSPWAVVLDDGPEHSGIGMLASVDVEITGRVGPGETLRYDVRQSHLVGGLSRYAVSASASDRTVARGTIVGARLEVAR